MGRTPIQIKDNKPMMADKEVEIIVALIEQHSNNLWENAESETDFKHLRCLEWGAGNSTVFFPKLADIGTWLSIEHNGHYARFLSPLIEYNTTLMWLPQNELYYDCLKHSEPVYDFILIDGEFRKECLETAMRIARPGAVILLHDSGRTEYQEWINQYPHEVLSIGEIPDKGGFAHRGLTRFIK